MSILIARWCGSDSIQELHCDDDGGYHMETFLRERDCDRKVTTQEAGEWLEYMKRCGGTVLRHITGWPEKGEVG